MTAPVILLAFRSGVMIGAEEVDLAADIENVVDYLADHADDVAAAAAMLDRLAVEDRPYPDFLECWHGRAIFWRKSPRDIVLAASRSGCLLARELDDLDAWKEATE